MLGSPRAIAFTLKGLYYAHQSKNIDYHDEIEALANHSDQASARVHFGLDPETVTLLVTGGSLGAKRINQTVEDSRTLLSAAGIQVLHIVGGKSELSEVSTSDYQRIKYCDRMDLAIAASDFAVSRAGASTVSEFAAVGLPAVYIPYPVGNGEQKFNVRDLVDAGGGLMVPDAEFTPDYVAEKLIPLMSNTKVVTAMRSAARAAGINVLSVKLQGMALSAALTSIGRARTMRSRGSMLHPWMAMVPVTSPTRGAGFPGGPISVCPKVEPAWAKKSAVPKHNGASTA